MAAGVNAGRAAEGMDMLDGWARGRIDPAIDGLAKRLAAAGLGANTVTFAAFAVGLSAAVAIAYGQFAAALALILISRVGDALDGAIARRTTPSDRGGYLDIVLDFAFYAVIPFAFALFDPAANAVAAGALLVSFYVNGASFLAYAVIAEKRGMQTGARGSKSFFFTTGLAEASETIIAFCLMCLFPQWFALIACVFAAMTAWTTFARMLLAWREFG